MEIRQSARSFPGRTIAVVLALLAVLAIALAAWQLVAGNASSPATRSAPVNTTYTGQHYVEPDAPDRTQQLQQPSEGPDRAPTHGALP